MIDEKLKHNQEREESAALRRQLNLEKISLRINGKSSTKWTVGLKKLEDLKTELAPTMPYTSATVTNTSLQTLTTSDRVTNTNLVIRDASEILKTHKVLKSYILRQMKARNNIKEISRDRNFTIKSRQEKQAQKHSDVRKNRTATSVERPARPSPDHVQQSPY